MPDDILSTAFEISSSDIDAETVMQQIRAQIRARRAEARAKGLDFQAYEDGRYMRFMRQVHSWREKVGI